MSLISRRPPKRRIAGAVHRATVIKYGCRNVSIIPTSLKLCTARSRVSLEAVQRLALPLLWKPLGDWLLFIFAITSRGPIVLMSSDLTLAPTTALELYCVRARIEIMFDVMKNTLKAFCFRFWTHHLPRHPRRPRANRYLQAPATAPLSTVAACWQAYETFVFLCGHRSRLAAVDRAALWRARLATPPPVPAHSIARVTVGENRQTGDCPHADQTIRSSLTKQHLTKNTALPRRR